MLNVFTIKKYSTLLLSGFIPTIFFLIGTTFSSFFIGLACFFGGLLISTLVGVLLLKNPFSQMLEGKGLLCFKMDSTGIIQPFILKVLQPFVKGKLGQEDINDVYNRSTVMNLANPVKEGFAQQKGTELTIKIDINEFNTARFGMFHYPVLIYNHQIKSLVTKDFLSEKEKSSFAEHGILYLNRKMEEMTGVLRDFGRYVVELTKPKASIFQNKWFWIIILVALVIMALLFAKPILNSIMGVGSTLTSSFNTVGNAVTPLTQG